MNGFFFFVILDNGNKIIVFVFILVNSCDFEDLFSNCEFLKILVGCKYELFKIKC